MLERLDVVVASVPSKVRMPEAEMTKRMLKAIESPHTDILGNCTGRLLVGRGRPQSTFDADKVFAACAATSTAVEINSRPERLDPPLDLLATALDAGCLFSINTDAHALGQLEWQENGCRPSGGGSRRSRRAGGQHPGGRSAARLDVEPRHLMALA